MFGLWKEKSDGRNFEKKIKKEGWGCLFFCERFDRHTRAREQRNSFASSLYSEMKQAGSDQIRWEAYLNGDFYRISDVFPWHMSFTFKQIDM